MPRRDLDLLVGKGAEVGIERAAVRTRPRGTFFGVEFAGNFFDLELGGYKGKVTLNL